MTVRERIISITLLEKMNNNPDIAKKLGLEGTMKETEVINDEDKVNDVK